MRKRPHVRRLTVASEKMAFFETLDKLKIIKLKGLFLSFNGTRIDRPGVYSTGERRKALGL